MVRAIIYLVFSISSTLFSTENKNNYRLSSTEDEFYSNLVENKEKNNRVIMIRNIINEMNDTIIKDTSTFVFNKYYNVLQNNYNTIYIDKFTLVNIDNKNKKIKIMNIMKSVKYPEIYSIIDLSSLFNYQKDSMNVYKIKYLSKQIVPFESNYALYKFSIHTKMLEYISYRYAGMNKVKMEILFLYDKVHGDNLTLKEVFFENKFALNNYENFKVEDMRRKNNE
jgi:hypothetical protein